MTPTLDPRASPVTPEIGESPVGPGVYTPQSNTGGVGHQGPVDSSPSADAMVGLSNMSIGSLRTSAERWREADLTGGDPRHHTVNVSV